MGKLAAALFVILSRDLASARFHEVNPLAQNAFDLLECVIGRRFLGRKALSQGLTRNIGYPKLREHLGAAIAFMKLSQDYFDFIDKMDQHYPRFGEQYRLPLPDPYDREKDDGKGL